MHNTVHIFHSLSQLLCMAYCCNTRGIVLGLWRVKGGESGMVGGEGG